MAKTYIHTEDIFNIKNVLKRNKSLRTCVRSAIRNGIYMRLLLNGDIYPKLELGGTKMQFLRYYFETFEMTDVASVWRHIKRIVDIALT